MGLRSCWSGTARRPSAPRTTTCCRETGLGAGPGARRAGWRERGVDARRGACTATMRRQRRHRAGDARGRRLVGVDAERRRRVGRVRPPRRGARRTPTCRQTGDLRPPRVPARLRGRRPTRWTAGEHDGDYTESLRRLRGPGPRRARPGTACDRRGGRGRGQLRRPDRRRLRRPARRRRPAAGSGAVQHGDVNTSVTRVVVGSTGARLLTFNEHPHLAGDQLTYR